MAYHNESTEEILRALGADPDTGLTGETAAARLAEHGENRLREKKKKSTLRRFLDQFKDVMILILLAAAPFRSSSPAPATTRWSFSSRC